MGSKRRKQHMRTAAFALCLSLLLGTGCGMEKTETTVTPAPEETATPTYEPTLTPTPSPTCTPTNTPTPTYTPTPTNTPTPVPLLDTADMTEEGLAAGIEYMGGQVLKELELSEKGLKDTALAIWTWVDENIKNGKDTYKEDENKAAYTGLREKTGGVVTKNSVFGALAELTGLKHIRVSAADPSYDHTWNLCLTEDGWYHFDYYSPKGGHYVCFMQTDEQVGVMTGSLYPYYHYYNLTEDAPARAETKVYNGYMEEWEKERTELLSEEEILALLEGLKSEYPTGKYWNHGGVTDIPCDHSVSMKTCNRYDSMIDRVYVHGSIGDQCRGFASLLSDAIFGTDAGVDTFASYEEVKVGDILRIMFVPGTTKQNCHSAVIIEKTDEYVLVAEANYDYKTCRIRWGGKYTRDYLESCGTWYITRVR